MKKMFLLSLAVPAMLLLSFTFQQRGIKKIGANLYTVSSTKSISAADQEQLKKIIAERYGITDFSKDVVITAKNPVNAKGGWILNRSIFRHLISTRCIKWDKAAALTDDVQKTEAILSKYSAR